MCRECPQERKNEEKEKDNRKEEGDGKMEMKGKRKKRMEECLATDDDTKPTQKTLPTPR